MMWKISSPFTLIAGSLLFGLSTGYPNLSMAALNSVPSNETRPQDQGTRTENQRLVLTRDDCRRLLTKADPAAAAYKPGTDVQGRAVAPANLDKQTDYVPKTVQGDLLRGPSGLPGGGRLPARSELNVGQLLVDTESGQVSFGGQKLDPPAVQALEEVCRKAGID